jgi:hypothetical protein
MLSQEAITMTNFNTRRIRRINAHITKALGTSPEARKHLLNHKTRNRRLVGIDYAKDGENSVSVAILVDMANQRIMNAVKIPPSML